MLGVNWCGKAQKSHYLESRSATTMMIDLFPTLGNPTMKSMEISVHMDVGMGMGWWGWRVPGMKL